MIYIGKSRWLANNNCLNVSRETFVVIDTDEIC